MSRHYKGGGWLIGAIVLVAAASLMHPFGRVKALRPSAMPAAGSLLTAAPAPDAVRHALESKCADCHSSQTHWPAYSYLAPVSWLVERDVAEGRRNFNLSSWQTYSREQKLDLLNRIAAEARTGEMPPRQYTFIHSSSLLSADERQEIYSWAKGTRRQIQEGAAK